MTAGSLNEIVLFQPDEAVRLEVLLGDETVWLTQAQMAELFGSTRNNVTMHIRNIFSEGELLEDVVCKDFLLTTQHGAVPSNSPANRAVKEPLTATYNQALTIRLPGTQ